MLNNEQLKAVCHEAGSALIKAGPGSGKTTVITHHINYLLTNKLAKPYQILVISFSKASAQEMKERFINQFSENGVFFGTFHSVFYRFLKNFSSFSSTVISDRQKSKLLYSITKSQAKADKYESLISLYKSHINKTIILDDEFCSIYKQYEYALECNELIDYDDILINCYNMLKTNEEICTYIKKQFKYILIDEFQDINEYQYETIKMISNDNLYVVGDINQSIYSFRGADSQIIDKFKNDFKYCFSYELLSNYRCHRDIIKASYKMINNTEIIKDTLPAAIHNESGNHFKLTKVKSKEEEFYEIKNFIDASDKKESIAILLRTNNDVEEYKRKISLIYDESNELLINAINKIIFYYLDYVLYRNKDSLLNIINIPNRYIPRNILNNNSIELISSNKELLFYNELNKFNMHINTLRKSKPVTFCLYLKNIIKITDYLYEVFPDYDKDIINKQFDLIINNAVNFGKTSDYYSFIGNNIKNVSKHNLNINIMTFHASKGLEFDRVLIPDVIEGVIPGRISIGNMNVEEERRLLYVAMTRAKSFLEIITLYNEDSSKYIPSRFISVLFKNPEE